MDLLPILGAVVILGLIVAVPFYFVLGGANGRNWRRIKEAERQRTEQENRERQARKK